MKKQEIEEKSSIFGLNWQHYVAAMKIYYQAFPPNKSISEKEGVKWIPIEQIGIHSENKKKLEPDYFAFYIDILGFSAELELADEDTLPDFYGAAWAGAIETPKVKVFQFSDSCLAVCRKNDIKQLISFIRKFLGNTRADGILGRGAIGFGSFVDRKPDLGPQAKNFWGRQVAGTSIIEAVKLCEGKNHPKGARIFVTERAYEYLPLNLQAYIVKVQDKLEFLVPLPLGQNVFDCLFYLLCLRDCGEGLREHYICSIISRLIMIPQKYHITIIRLAGNVFENKKKLYKIIEFINKKIGEYQNQQ